MKCFYSLPRYVIHNQNYYVTSAMFVIQHNVLHRKIKNWIQHFNLYDLSSEIFISSDTRKIKISFYLDYQ